VDGTSKIFIEVKVDRPSRDLDSSESGKD